MAIFLTSDLHLFHNRDFIYESRGFCSIEEMHMAIIDNWNKVVKPNDEVYILGDLMLNCEPEQGLDIISRLNGKKYIAIGNHDTNTKLKAYKESGLFEDIQYGYRIKYHKTYFILTHYPTLVGNMGDKTPIWNLYGHTHQIDNFLVLSNKNFETIEELRNYHVGMDSHNCTPVSIDNVIEDIKKEKEINNE